MSQYGSPTQQHSDKGDKGDKVKRGYRACLHCRSRKAKCDLGDVDAPSSPPCTRCKRESRECVFAPSRRGGNNAKRKMKTENDSPTDYADDLPHMMSAVASGSGTHHSEIAQGQAQMAPTAWAGINVSNPYPPPQRPELDRFTHTSGSDLLGDLTHGQAGGLQQRAEARETTYGRSALDGVGHDPRSASSNQTPSSFSTIQQLLQPTPPNPFYGHNGSTTHFSPVAESTPSQHGHTPHAIMNPVNSGPNSVPSLQSGRQTPSPKRRRLHLHPPVHAADASSIVVADMQNESDALHILALASQHGDRDGHSGGRGDHNGNGATNGTGSSNDPRRGQKTTGKGGGAAVEANLRDFALIKLGIASEEQVTRLTDIFFRCHHHLLPMVPSYLIPHTPAEIAAFAQNERYLLTAMIIIASRHDTSQSIRQVHDRSWALMRGWLSDIQCLGAPPTVGLVEALLLLAENLPRDPARTSIRNGEPGELRAIGAGEESHSAENRQAWMLMGMAIRSAYGLGLDKLAVMLFSDTERSQELERGRLAFTYCYLFDRHVSLRLGKAFWSRGPAICFQGFSSSGQTGPNAASGNFPFLREIKPGEADHPQDDFASLIQAYLELTQMMSSAHDTLYPNAARTRSLVVYGEYFKYLDELARSLDGFKILWRQKKWSLFPLADAVWAMFYYTQLYICAFSFQAHVERAAMRAEEEYQLLEQQHKASGSRSDLPRPPLSLFPRGAAASPDARFIVQCNDAARALLHICVDSLSPGGALPYLPSRYLLWFTYAAIVLLKACYSGAMLRADHAETLNLIDRLCVCLAQTSSDEDHPAARYSRQIKGLKQKLSSLSSRTAANSPTGGSTVPLPPMSGDRPAETNGPGRAQGFYNANLPWVPNVDSSNAQQQQNQQPSTSPGWQFPNLQPPAQPISFPYPSTPSGSGLGGIGYNSSSLANFVAPPHQQPLSEVNNLPPVDPANNLGFTTIGEDWFGLGVEGMSGLSGAGVGPIGGAGAGDGDSEHGLDGLGGFDLADFWMKVGPGEAQGGFPFR